MLPSSLANEFYMYLHKMDSFERAKNKELSNPTINSSPSSLLVNITILVVDDDSTSLTIISAMLREWSYEVATVKNPLDAVTTIRAHPTGIDLVVTDLHMPEMNGFELQKIITREFQLPVIIMSSDNDENVMLRSLEAGAVFFMVKPVNPEDLKNVWQYAVAGKKGKSIVTEDIGSIEGGSSSSAGKLSAASSSSENDGTKNAKRGTKRKKGDKQERKTYRRKKAKVVWTNTLHNMFIDAIRHIGMERAVPKKILEHMNVTCLTRENVASHLQKYRIFLKRIAEKNCFASKALAERILKSSFASGHPMLLRTAAQEYSRLQESQLMRGLTFNPGYGQSSLLGNQASLLGSSSLFPNYQNIASSSNSVPPLGGYGQSSLLGNQANSYYRQQVSGIGNTNPLYQGNRVGYANRSNISLNGTALPAAGSGLNINNASNGLMNGSADPMRAYQQQIQATRPDFNYNAGGSSSQFRFGSSPGFRSPDSTLGTGNISSTPYPTLDSSCINNNNNSYTAIRLTSDRQPFGRGQTLPNNIGGYGTMNGGSNHQNMNVGAAMGNMNGGRTYQNMNGSAAIGNMNGGSNYQNMNVGAGAIANMNGGSNYQNMNVGAGAMGNATTFPNFMQAHQGQGGLSSTGLYGSANQVSSAYNTAAANQQAANNSVLPMPGLCNRGSVTDYNSYRNQMNNNNAAGNNPDNNISTLSDQEPSGLLSDLLLESSNYNQFPNQQQVGGDGVRNPELDSGSLYPEIYPTLDELLNFDFSESLSLEDTTPRDRTDEQALENVQSGGDDQDQSMDTGVDGGAYPLDELFPANFNLDQLNSNQQPSGGEQLNDSEHMISSVFPVNNIAPAPASGDHDSSDNQYSTDDFIDSLLSFSPHFE